MRDYYTDFGHTFFKTIKDGGLPDLLKTASIVDPSDIDNLEDTAFADQVNRKYPINSRADTYMSVLYSEQEDGVPQHVKQAIDHAVEFWGIKKEAQELKEKIAGNAPKEIQPTKWSISVVVGENQGIDASGYDAESLKQASEQIMERLQKKGAPYEDQVKIANHLCKQFELYNEEPPLKLAAAAEKLFPDPQHVARQIKARAPMLPMDKMADFIKIANQIEESEERTLVGYKKIARFIDEFDRKNDLIRFYGHKINPPALSVFSVDPKEAAKMASIVVIDGDEYTPQELEEKDPELFKVALSPDQWNTIFKDGEKDFLSINDFPEESKSRLAQYLR